MKQPHLVITALSVAVLVLTGALVLSMRPRSIVINTGGTMPEIILSDDLPVTINSTHEVPSITLPSNGRVMEPQSGNVYLVCNLTVKNTGTEPFKFSPTNLILYKSSGSFTGALLYLHGTLFSSENDYATTIPAGDSVTFDVPFEVPTGAKPTKIGVDSGKRTITG